MRPHFLRANLCFLHGTTVASEGLLEAAIRKLEPNDLNMYFSRHLDEETGHLAMLERDLTRLGVERILKFPAAAQLAGAQYYYIEHDHPAMLLGYMAALECSPLSIEQIDSLEAEHGSLPCIRHHAMHDVAHGEQLRREIVSLPYALRGRVLENEQFVLHDLRTRIVPMIEQASQLFLRQN